MVRRGWYALLVLPFIATLVPPIYARSEPSIGGWPFFYWWQFAWIVITALILAFVYRVTTTRASARSQTAPHPRGMAAGDDDPPGGGDG